MDDFRRLKQLEVGNCIMTLLVYVVPLSDKPEFRETCIKPRPRSSEPEVDKAPIAVSKAL